MTRSKNILQDDRTQEQKQYLTNIVVGRDRLLSGWGKAEGKTSYAGWACCDKDVQKVKEWVDSRLDIERVVVVDSNWEPCEGSWHFHIYNVEEGHPALS